MKTAIRKHFSDSAVLMERTGELYSDLVLATAGRIAGVLSKGGKVLTCGNGGSASDAEHIAAEFVGRFRRERQPLPAISLTTNSATITSIGNDYGFEQVFARQVMAHGSSGDILIAISTSGTSANVLAAVRAAKTIGMFTVGFAGQRTEGLSSVADAVFAVPSGITAEIQQCHIAIAHAICETLDEILAKSL